MNPTRSSSRTVNRTLKFALVITSMALAAQQCTLAQGYVAEIQGDWKTDHHVIVKKGDRLVAGAKINSYSGSKGDMIILVGPTSDVVAQGNCIAGCQAVTVPNTQTWSGYFYCLVVKCGSIKYSTSGTKGDECTGVDGIVGLDESGVTDLAQLLEFGERTQINLRFQRRIKGRIDEVAYELTKQNTTVKQLNAGLYDVIDGDQMSRVLVLPSAPYSLEKAGFRSLKDRSRYWKEHGIGNCTIKSFTQAYVNHVAQKYKKQLAKAD